MSPIYVPGKLTLDNGTRPAAIAGVAPTLDYRFARDKREIETVSLADKLTYSGANGTFIGSDGFIQQAGTSPRFNHDAETRQSLGLLIESQSTNLITYSENYLINPWATPLNPVLEENAAISPDGTQNATLIRNSIFNSQLNYPFSFSDLQVYTISIFVKKTPNTTSPAWSLRSAGSGGASRIQGNFDLDDITATAVNAVTNATIQNYGNGWYRCSVSGPVSSGENRIATGEARSANDEMYMWGAQIELSASSTSYIPTFGSTVTRTESAVIEGAGIITGTFTMVEKPAGCAVVNAGNIELQAGYTAERVMVFPAALSAQQITDIRSSM